MFKRKKRIDFELLREIERSQFEAIIETQQKQIKELKEVLRKKSTDKKSLIDNVVNYGQRKVTFELPKIDENEFEGVIFRYNGNVYAVVMKNGEAVDFKEI